MPFSLGWGCLIATSLGLLTVVVKAQGTGDSATGTLQVANERFMLKHVFAVMEEDPFSNGEKEKLTVLLSDVPVPAEMHKASNEWRIWLSDKAQAGAIHGLTLNIDPETKIWDGGNVVTKGGFMFYTESVFGGSTRNLHFEPSGTIDDHVAAKISMKEPMSGMPEENGPWKVDAQFRSVVIHRPAVTARLTGTAALNSPQYKAAMAFLESCRKKDVEAIRASIDPRSRNAMMEMFSGSGKEDSLNQFAQMATDTLTYNLTRITVRGDTADVEFKDAKPDSGSSQTLHVVLSAGEWKIAR
jgi:hypothetical protein